MTEQEHMHEIIKVAAELCREPSEGQYPGMCASGETALNAANCRKAKRLKNAVDGLREYIRVMEDTIYRSGFDIQPCRLCGESVVCLPDGGWCAGCAAKMEAKQ